MKLSENEIRYITFEIARDHVECVRIPHLDITLIYSDTFEEDFLNGIQTRLEEFVNSNNLLKE